MDKFEYVKQKAQSAKNAFGVLSNLSTAQKNAALKSVSDSLIKNMQKILSANEKDLHLMRSQGMREALLERLTVDEKRIHAMKAGLEHIISLPDPVFDVENVIKRPNGILISKVRVPIGVIGIIYESRPDVTLDAASICLKSSNAVILKGGKEAINTNIAIVEAIHSGLSNSDIPSDCVQFIEDTDRMATTALMEMTGLVDLLIPRGGKGLINAVLKNAKVPVIKTGEGNCHLYVDDTSNLNMALNIAYNGKTQRPGACNAIETILVHEKIADKFLPVLYDKFKNEVEMRGCVETRKIMPEIKIATEDDYNTEFLDMIVAIKIVGSIDEAIEHIAKYGTCHSEVIVTDSLKNAEKFKREVDAAAVYVNASSRFTDGGEFGFGAEIGISTQKFHARGPMGLKEMTTYKYVITGEGQIR